MESVLKVGRTMSNGVCRAAGALAWGTRRILATIPLLGITGVAREPHESESNITVRHLKPSHPSPTSPTSTGSPCRGRNFSRAHTHIYIYTYKKDDKRKRIESHLSISLLKPAAGRHDLLPRLPTILFIHTCNVISNSNLLSFFPIDLYLVFLFFIKKELFKTLKKLIYF